MTQRRPRIVKPRSPKQRANAKRFSTGSGRFVIQPKDTGLPQSSWWAYAPQDGFTVIAELQARRMRLSKFGSLRSLIGDEA